MSSSDVKISSQLDYKAKLLSHPTYQFSRVNPLGGGTSVAMTIANGDNSVEFELPTLKAFNLSESILSWQLDISAPGTEYVVTAADTYGEVKTIELLTAEGNALARIEDANVFMQLVRPIETKLDDLLTGDKQDCLRSCDVAAVSNLTPTEAKVAMNKSYVNRRYIDIGDEKKAVTLYRKLKLGYLVNSIFAVNKDLLFPTVIKIRVVFKGDRIGWVAAAATPHTLVGPITLPANSITNLNLYLAVEQNLDIANSLIAKVKEGMNLPIPYIWRIKSNMSAATNQNVSLRIGSTHGRTLKKIIHAIYNATESNSPLMYDHNNIGADEKTAAKVTQYYTQLDNTKTTQFDIRGALNYGEDYMLHRNCLKGSCIPSQVAYSYSWFHEEDFTNSGSPNDNNKDGTDIISGLDLSTEKKFDFVGVDMVSAAYSHYDYVFVQRLLSITPNLVDCK